MHIVLKEICHTDTKIYDLKFNQNDVLQKLNENYF